MPGPRRGTTAEPATPIEETEPTAPAVPAPEPVDPDPDEPTDEQRQAAASLAAEVVGGREPDDWTPKDYWELHPRTMELIEEQTRAIVGDALADIRRGPFGLAAAQRDDNPLSVGEAIAEVTRRIGAIEKTGRSTEGYRFRGIDQALAALHPILGDVGLSIVPSGVVREQWDTRATSKGGTLNVARLLVRYTFVGPDGSELSAAAWGEGADAGDKATQKAHSQSYKTLVFQTFTIPTETSAEDEADATNDAARPFTAEEQERAGAAYEAALDAPSLERLIVVRQRALALLDVPVRMADGGLIPLRALFESRRLALESAAEGSPA